MTTRTSIGVAAASVLVGAMALADTARAQAVTVRRPVRAPAVAAPSPTPFSQQAVAAATTPTPFPQRPSKAPATTLFILVGGSSGDDSGVWGKSLGVSIPRSITLGVRAFSDYASLLWEVADRPFDHPDAATVRTGHVADAAAPGELLLVVIGGNEFLPPGRPPEPPQDYFIRVTTLDAGRSKVGTSNSVRLTYATLNALVLPADEFASPGEAVRVSQSCTDSRTRVALCVADPISGWNSPHCTSASFSCLPYACHKGGVSCNSACLDDSDCAEPARCHRGQASQMIGECLVPVARCTDRTHLATPFEMVDCFPYACKTLDTGQAYCAACPCDSGADCAHDIWCRADGTCGEPRD